jgi:hypothetical protein
MYIGAKVCAYGEIKNYLLEEEEKNIQPPYIQVSSHKLSTSSVMPPFYPSRGAGLPDFSLAKIYQIGEKYTKLPQN